VTARIQQGTEEIDVQTHRIEKPMPGAQRAYLANGLIGLRIPKSPQPKGAALVNGIVDLATHRLEG